MIQRLFPPGSDWLYYKIYAGSSTSEQILIYDLYDIVEYCVREKLIKAWFFIRYADPQFHLRVRFKLSNSDSFNSVMTYFYNRIKHRIDCGTVSCLQIDTYAREIERYGSDLIELAENLFYIDSDNSLKVLRLISSPQYHDRRWMISLLLVDSFLSAFKFTSKAKSIFCAELFEHYKKDMNVNSTTSRKIYSVFRENKDEITKLLSYKHNSDETINCVIKLLDQKRNIIFSLCESNVENFRNHDLNFLIAQYIHMMLNRFFISKGREHEMMVYSIMSKYYQFCISCNKTEDE